MTALELLRRFVVARVGSPDELPEIREYISIHADDIAAEFGVTISKLGAAIVAVGDDEKLAGDVLATIKTHVSKGKGAKRDAKTLAAQSAADGLSVRWEHGTAYLDIDALAACSSDRKGLFYFRGESFSVAIRQDLIVKIAKLKRESVAWVDAQGFHVRFASGGFNLVPYEANLGDVEMEHHCQREALPLIVVNLPRQAQAA